jgi:hypothetical protein
MVLRELGLVLADLLLLLLLLLVQGDLPEERKE